MFSDHLKYTGTSDNTSDNIILSLGCYVIAHIGYGQWHNIGCKV